MKIEFSERQKIEGVIRFERSIAMIFTHYSMFIAKSISERLEVFNLFKERYSQMVREIPQVISAVVLENCVDRFGNCDILVKLELTDESGLQAYIKHELHLRLMEETAGRVEKVCGFDCIKERL